jgi:hypothetical protein
VHAPFIREDGSICDLPGYDEASAAYLIPNAEFPSVPDQVSGGARRRVAPQALPSGVIQAKKVPPANREDTAKSGRSCVSTPVASMAAHPGREQPILRDVIASLARLVGAGDRLSMPRKTGLYAHLSTIARETQ